MPDNTQINVGFGTPFEAQIEYLRNKIRLPTERAGDISRGANDRAFVIAGAAKADLLSDMQAAMVKAAESGGGLNAFRKDFKSIVAKHGWTGWTGEGTKEGEAWRTRIIYQTNMATSYAAGRRAQMTEPGYIRFHPYWRYLHSDGVLHPRLHHLAWHGLTLRHDHPFWDTHFAPNGYGCQCRITSVTKREGEASARAGLGQPPEGWKDINPKTGEPVGIDKGFGYAPGANVDTPLRQMVQNKLITYPEAISSALSSEINKYINASAKPAAFAAEALANAQHQEVLWLGFVENFEQVNGVAKADTKGFLVLLPSDAVRHVEKAHGNDGNDQRAAVPSDYASLHQVLTQPDILKAGTPVNSMERFTAEKTIDGEKLRAVFEVRPGKKSRALVLITLVVKTAK
jgi:Phage Mu protein F like protein